MALDASFRDLKSGNKTPRFSKRSSRLMTPTQSSPLFAMSSFGSDNTSMSLDQFPMSLESDYIFSEEWRATPDPTSPSNLLSLSSPLSIESSSPFSLPVSASTMELSLENYVPAMAPRQAKARQIKDTNVSSPPNEKEGFAKDEGNVGKESQPQPPTAHEGLRSFYIYNDKGFPSLLPKPPRKHILDALSPSHSRSPSVPPPRPNTLAPTESLAHLHDLA